MIQEIEWINYPENKPEGHRNILKMWSGFGEGKPNVKTDYTDFTGSFDDIAGGNKIIAFAYMDIIDELEERAGDVNLETHQNSIKNF